MEAGLTPPRLRFASFRILTRSTAVAFNRELAQVLIGSGQPFDGCVATLNI